LFLEQEMNVDRDHRVLGIHCCDSKCSANTTSTWWNAVYLWLSMVWWWRSDSIERAFNYMYNHHMFPLWESSAIRICRHDISTKWFGNVIKI